ncbi:MAG TPA: PQQ-binding-like beta-propeller repeat protein [Planctomycetota bacterium]|nr:PQQ-binding-like beta-propeller repeat protein [Planctomycetota bacterium]HRR81995.1 PQQ-binding-like beta-propeller repeat protein [Planctomycetota bacterium]HRT94447.1 PQQ-binding-like beta-propeller repeat protein [Planctomycetota bacterium]
MLRAPAGVVTMLLASTLLAADWPQWGGRDCRNMASDEKGIPESFDPGQKKEGGSEVDPATTKNIQWAARLGTETYGNPTVSGGRVFVGTNNGAPRDPRLKGDRSILMCLEEATGKFLWQLAVSKYPGYRSWNGDYQGLGICSSPTVEGDRVYVVTNRDEVLCLDVNGLANGNDGPFQDEGEYIAAQRRRKPGKQPPGAKPDEKPEEPVKPIELTPTDADILWRYDMIAELDAWPQDASACSVLVHGDLVYVNPSNGVDLSHKNIPSPQVPTIIALDKRTGKLVATDEEKIGPTLFHGTWSSPSLAEVNGRKLLLFGAGDGFVYAFDPTPVEVPGKPLKVLKTVWKCDANPPEYRMRDGKKLPYNKNAEGPSEITGTVVCHNNRVYVTIGQDTRHGAGKGCLTCIDATKAGDISTTGILWRYTGINRSMATPSVADGLVFAADYVATVHCVDAETGKAYWTHETGGRDCMGSTFVADGKVWFGNKNGKLTVLAAGREKKLLAEISLRTPIHATPIVANGVLYVACNNYLYAVAASQGTGK